MRTFLGIVFLFASVTYTHAQEWTFYSGTIISVTPTGKTGLNEVVAVMKIKATYGIKSVDNTNSLTPLGNKQVDIYGSTLCTMVGGPNNGSTTEKPINYRQFKTGDTLETRIKDGYTIYVKGISK